MWWLWQKVQKPCTCRNKFHTYFSHLAFVHPVHTHRPFCITDKDLLRLHLLAAAVDTDIMAVAFEPGKWLQQALGGWAMLMGQVVQSHQQLHLGLAEWRFPSTWALSWGLLPALASRGPLLTLSLSRDFHYRCGRRNQNPSSRWRFRLGSMQIV